MLSRRRRCRRLAEHRARRRGRLQRQRHRRRGADHDADAASAARVPAHDPAATIGAWGTTSRPRTKQLLDHPGRRPRSLFGRRPDPAHGQSRSSTSSSSAPATRTVQHERAEGRRPVRQLRARSAPGARLRRPRPPGAADAPDGPACPWRSTTRTSTSSRPWAASPRPRCPAAPWPTCCDSTPVSGPRARPSRSRLGLLAGDPAGFPNGRRVSDDVTDISSRAVAGVLLGASVRQPRRRRRQHQEHPVPGDLPLRGLRGQREEQPPHRSRRGGVRRHPAGRRDLPEREPRRPVAT